MKTLVSTKQENQGILTLLIIRTELLPPNLMTKNGTKAHAPITAMVIKQYIHILEVVIIKEIKNKFTKRSEVTHNTMGLLK